MNYSGGVSVYLLPAIRLHRVTAITVVSRACTYVRAYLCACVHVCAGVCVIIYMRVCAGVCVIIYMHVLLLHSIKEPLIGIPLFVFLS